MYNANLLINTDELVDNNKNLPITGKGFEKSIMIFDNDSLSFGDVIVGTDSTKQINIFNNGQIPLSIYSVYFSGSDKECFSSDFNSEIIIDPNQNGNIAVTFIPTDSRQLFGNYLNIFSSVPNTSISKIAMDGHGVFPPEIECIDTLDFGEVYLSDEKSEVLTIKNIGKSPIYDIKVNLISENYSYQFHSPIDILQNSEIEINVYFEPKISVGIKTAELIISSGNYGFLKTIYIRGRAL